MKTLLNLLPEKKKKDIRSRLHFRFFLWQLFLVFSLAIFYLVILLSIFFILDFQLQGLRQGVSEYGRPYDEEQTLDAYQRKFRETNSALETVGRIERSHLSFAEIFVLLDTVVPERVAINRLSTKGYTVMLMGQAATRDDLLTFDSRLKESACVQNVNIPISNLFSQDNIEFQIDFEMKKECLQKNAL